MKSLPPLVLTLVLSACSLLRPQAAPAVLPLLAPSTLGTSRSALQLVHGAFGERDVAFQCVVDVSPEHMTLVGLSAQGQRWFSLRYDGSKLEAQSNSQAPPLLDPQRVLIDLQLALWPLAALQQTLADSGWQVTQTAPATRRLLRDGRLVAEVHYTGADPWQGQLWLSNFDHGYTLAVESRPLP